MNDLARQLKEANSPRKKAAPKNMGPGHTTKKIRAILKLMTEFGITRYKDELVEMEMGHAIVPPAQQGLDSKDSQAPFSFGNYAESDDDGDSDLPAEENEMSDSVPTEPSSRDDLGYSDDDYLWRSAEV